MDAKIKKNESNKDRMKLPDIVAQFQKAGEYGGDRASYSLLARDTGERLSTGKKRADVTLTGWKTIARRKKMPSGGKNNTTSATQATYGSVVKKGVSPKRITFHISNFTPDNSASAMQAQGISITGNRGGINQKQKRQEIPRASRMADDAVQVSHGSMGAIRGVAENDETETMENATPVAPSKVTRIIRSGSRSLYHGIGSRVSSNTDIASFEKMLGIRKGCKGAARTTDSFSHQSSDAMYNVAPSAHNTQTNGILPFPHEPETLSDADTLSAPENVSGRDVSYPSEDMVNTNANGKGLRFFSEPARGDIAAYQGIVFGKTTTASSASKKVRLSGDDKRIKRRQIRKTNAAKKNKKVVWKKQMRYESKRFVVQKILAAEEKEQTVSGTLVNLFKGYAGAGMKHAVFFVGSQLKKFLLFAAPAIVLTVICVSLLLVLISCLGSKEAHDAQAAPAASYASYTPVSKKVESYRERVLQEAKKYGKEQYIELFLAVMMQESGGYGNDIFQCSESLGLPPNTLDVDASIRQGVKYLSAMLDKAKVPNPQAIETIKLAIQGYNMGGGYIDYALKADGHWTQENVMAYARDKSGGVRNSDARAKLLGPWRFGDSYYTEHVLRYYPYASTYVEGNEKDAIAVPLEKRMNWLFPKGAPQKAEEMRDYLTAIDVPILNEKGKETTMKITVHKKLTANIKGAFEDMKKAKFKVLASETAGYTWRTMASNSGKVSYHSYGCVVDLNWTHNGATYTGWPYNPHKDEYAVTDDIVEIWKEHGFYWGGNWSKAYFDPMHFTYVNH